jgi:hypothetical protein
MEEESDILGDLSYVAGNFDKLDKETIILVIQSAIAEIIDLRIALKAKTGTK